MPRLPTSLLNRARSRSPLLVPLLRTCRDLEAARCELRWLWEFVCAKESRREDGGRRVGLLRKLCWQRGRGKPLQYILGTEFFGELEIYCRRGVLIPRHDTADLILALVRRLHHIYAQNKAPPHRLRILDLCTGTGCISLLLYHELRKAFHTTTETPLCLEIFGVDIAAKAVDLARANRRRLFPGVDGEGGGGGSFVGFERADVFGGVEKGDESGDGAPGLMDLLEQKGWMEWDILVSNPPYISPSAFYKDTNRSVRNFEPRLALVPPTPSRLTPSREEVGSEDGGGGGGGGRGGGGDGGKYANDKQQADLFYPRLLHLASLFKAKTVLFEVGDMEQAVRVARMAVQQSATTDPSHGSSGNVEIWRDGLGDEYTPVEEMEIEIDGGTGREEGTEGDQDEEGVKVGEKVVEVTVKGPRGVESHGRGVVWWRGENEGA